MPKEKIKVVQAGIVLREPLLSMSQEDTSVVAVSVMPTQKRMVCQ